MQNFSKRIIPVLLLAAGTMFQSCARETVVYRKVPDRLEEGITVLRVLLVDNADRIEVSSEHFIAAGLRKAASHSQGYAGGGRLTASCVGGKVCLKERGRTVFTSDRILLKAEGNDFLKLGGNGYRGRILLTPEGGDGLSAVNYVEVDDYLRGVLPAEIGYLEKNSYEAYRVQALASRSYALSKLHETRERYYDLRATIMDQVYRGVEGEYPPATEAVEKTRGLVIMWEGKPARTYYSSCCGGHTADMRCNWPWKESYPFLRGIRDARWGESRSFCRGSGHFRWRVSWTGSKLTGILSRTLPDICKKQVKPFHDLLDMEEGGYSSDGRIKSITFITDSGRYTVRGDRIRWALRPDSATGSILRSTLIKLDVIRDGGSVKQLRVLGGGNGHGVGMCQSGAIEMAREGYRAEDIISHFYPGVTIGSYY